MLKKGYSVFFLLLIAIFYAINNYFIVKDNLSIPVNPDEAGHLVSSLNYYYNILAGPSLERFMLLLRPTSYYPPLFHFSAAILYFFFGTSRIVSVMTNIAYFLIMLFSVYFIGKKIKNENTGLFACFILSMFPMIFGMSKWFMLEFALTAMVCFSVCCLVYSENFTNRKYSLLFGLSLGLGMLTKYQFVFFIIGPFLCVLLNRRKKIIPNLFYAITIGLLICIKWYYSFLFSALKPMRLIEFLRILNIGCSNIIFPRYSLDGLLFYFRSIFFYEISPFFLILLILILALFIKAKVENKAILITWLLASYTILTLIGSKWSHYIMPVLPALALILAIGILSVPFRRMRYSLICLTILGGYIQFFYVSYLGYNHIERLINRSLINLKLMRYPISSQNMWNYTDSVPYGHYKKLGRIIANEITPYIKEASQEKKDLIVGTMSLRCHRLDLYIDYLTLRDKRKNISMLEFLNKPSQFLIATLLGRYDLLFIISEENLRLDDEYYIEKIFKENKPFANMLNFSKEDYRIIAEIFKKLYRNFEVIRVEKIDTDIYLRVLTKRDNTDSEIITKEEFDKYLFLLRRSFGKYFEDKGLFF